MTLVAILLLAALWDQVELAGTLLFIGCVVVVLWTAGSLGLG